MFPVWQYSFKRDEDKNKKLKKERNIEFEDIIAALQSTKNIIDIVPNPNETKYPNQRHLIIKRK